MVVMDAKYKFVIIDVGSQGRFSDGGIFSSSAMANKINNNNKGDEAFPLLENLMRIYPRKCITGNYEN